MSDKLLYAGYVYIGALTMDKEIGFAIGKSMPEEGSVVEVRQTSRGIGIAVPGDGKCSYFVSDKKVSDAIDAALEQGWEVSAVMAETEHTKLGEKYYVNISGMSPECTALEAQRYRACMKMDRFGYEHPSLTSSNFDDALAIAYLKSLKSAQEAKKLSQQKEKESKLSYKFGQLFSRK